MSDDRDWGDFRKLFTQLPPAFERLPFTVRSLAAELGRRCDRKGRIIPWSYARDEHPSLVGDLMFHVRAHESDRNFLETGVEVLLADGFLSMSGGWLTIRNFEKAQESESAKRMRKTRELDRAKRLIENGENSDARDAQASPPSPGRSGRSGLSSDPTDQDQPDRSGSRESDPPAEQLALVPDDPPPPDQVRQVFNHWRKVLWSQASKREPKFSDDRTRIIRARLRSYSVADLCEVIDRASKSEFHVRSKNDAGKFYGDFDNLMGSEGKVDKWLASADGPRSSVSKSPDVPRGAAAARSVRIDP